MGCHLRDYRHWLATSLARVRERSQYFEKGEGDVYESEGRNAHHQPTNHPTNQPTYPPIHPPTNQTRHIWNLPIMIRFLHTSRVQAIVISHNCDISPSLRYDQECVCQADRAQLPGMLCRTA